MLARMEQSCYWEHETPAEEHFPCLDGVSTVCPRCCVERCPVETPDWFARCAAAGHPTWPHTRPSVPRKLICLEAPWNYRVFSGVSVKGFLDSLAHLLNPPLRVAHRYVESTRHLAYCAQRPDGLLWSDADAWDAPIFYLAFHGSPGAVTSPLESIDSAALCDAFTGYSGYPCLLYFGACNVLKGAKGERFVRDLLEASGVRAILGYTTSVDWMDSLVVDMLFFYRFYGDADPWKNLGKIFTSVRRDFQPAKAMGWRLVRNGP